MSEVGTSACTGYLVLYLVQYRIPRCELRVLRFRDTSPSACLSKSVLCDSHRDLRNARHATTSNKVQQASSSKHRYGIYNSWMNFGWRTGVVPITMTRRAVESWKSENAMYAEHHRYAYALHFTVLPASIEMDLLHEWMLYFSSRFLYRAGWRSQLSTPTFFVLFSTTSMYNSTT